MDLFREDFPPDDEVRPLSDFALDRVSDQDVYSKFITDLENGGGTVVSYANGPDAGGDLKKLVDHFQSLGLTIDILGPSRAQLIECARGLAQGLGLVTDFLRVNTPPTSVDMVADFGAVLHDARSQLARGGNFVNLQSLITVLSMPVGSFCSRVTCRQKTQPPSSVTYQFRPFSKANSAN